MNTTTNATLNQDTNNQNTVDLSCLTWREKQKYKEALVNCFSSEVLEKKRIDPDVLNELRRRVETLPDTLKMMSADTIYGHMSAVEKRNARIHLIKNDTLVVGVDIGKENLCLRVFEKDKSECTAKAFFFPNTSEGFELALEEISHYMVLFQKEECIVGMEPTGPYWRNFYSFMICHSILCVMVHTKAVHISKELEDNLPLKSDSKDPLVIANLVIGGNYYIPWVPEGLYAEMRACADYIDDAEKKMVMAKNQLLQILDVYAPEYRKITKTPLEVGFLFVLFERGLLFDDMVKLGEDGINQIYREHKLRGVGLKKAREVINAADPKLPDRDETWIIKKRMISLCKEIRMYKSNRDDGRKDMENLLQGIPETETLIEIKGVTSNHLGPLLAYIGDITRFNDDDELIKYSGLVPVLQQSGQHEGETRISKKGKSAIRKHLTSVSMSLGKYDPYFAAYLNHYMTRPINPLKYKQALIVVGCKFLRILKRILTTGEIYDPEKAFGKFLEAHPEYAELCA